MFLVGVAMRTHAVERYEGAVQELSLAVRWQERITRKLKKLKLCVPVLVQRPVDESTSGAGQSCARSPPASALSSEFCTVQVLAGPQNLSAL